MAEKQELSPEQLAQERVETKNRGIEGTKILTKMFEIVRDSVDGDGKGMTQAFYRYMDEQYPTIEDKRKAVFAFGSMAAQLAKFGLPLIELYQSRSEFQAAQLKAAARTEAVS